MNAIPRRGLFTLLAAAPLAAGAGLGSPAAADDGYALEQIPPSSPMPTYGRAELIKRWLRFTAAWPDQLAAKPAVLEATQGAWHTVRRCLAAMPIRRFDPDPVNRWEIKQPGEAGNCADIAVTMRAALARAGIPLGAVRPTLCEGALGEHMVLCLVTDRGDFILDMFDTAITPWPRSPYRWHARHVAINEWELLDPDWSAS